jgi:hypothetical protein
VPVGGVGNHAHRPGRLAEYHGVRTAGPGQLESGGDQAVPYRAARAPPPSGGFLSWRSVARHVSKLVDSIH